MQRQVAAVAIGLLSVAVSVLFWRNPQLAHRATTSLRALTQTYVASSRKNQAVPRENEMTTSAGARRVVVVGGGLAGCAAVLSAHAELSKAQGAAGEAILPVELVLVEKMAKLGGNSAKASSGINALGPDTGDTPQLFERDTLVSGGQRSQPGLVHTLVSESPGAISFLSDLGVDISKITLLGGHSVPRSHTNPAGGNVGWSIMSKVMAAVKALQGVTLMEGTKLEEVVVDEAGRVAGVKLLSAGPEQPAQLLAAQAVILATGGFAANRALLRQHCPPAAHLATTNGPWAQGEGLAVAERVGAALVDLTEVQIHPTGFVDPAAPEADTKFLAPEKLRGVGGVMLNHEGRRFVNELGPRDRVSAALLQQSRKQAWLVMPSAGAAEYGQAAIDFYCSKKLMTQVAGVPGLAATLAVGEAVLEAELRDYNQAAAGAVADAWGKTAFPASFDPSGVMFVALVTPVTHYTMGGVAIDSQARVLRAGGSAAVPQAQQGSGSASAAAAGEEGLEASMAAAAATTGTPVPGLYAAGEVSGWVHGRNRLGGNSLLECTVFGRIAGQQAVRHALGSSP